MPVSMIATLTPSPRYFVFCQTWGTPRNGTLVAFSMVCFGTALTDFTPESLAIAFSCLRGTEARMPLKADCVCEKTLPPRLWISLLTRSWDFFNPERIFEARASESRWPVWPSTTATGSPVISTMTVTLASESTEAGLKVVPMREELGASSKRSAGSA